MNGYRAIFRAVDCWFFSDGRPFNQDDDGLAQAESQFPPAPHVLASALRNLLAVENGGWDEDMLGNGLWDIGKLHLNGPRIGLDGPARPVADRAFAPVPSAYAAKPGDQPELSHHPAPPGHFETGQLRAEHLLRTNPLPRPRQTTDREYGAVDNLFADFSDWDNTSFDRMGGLHDPLLSGYLMPVYRGRDPTAAALASHETRVGLALNYAGKIVNDGDLFAVRYVRSDPAASLVVEFRVPDDMKALVDGMREKPLACTLGGRGKMALVRIEDDAGATLADPGRNRFWVQLMSPALIDDPAEVPVPGHCLPKVAGCRVLAAALPRLERFGGWDVARKARNWIWSLPAGASLLCEVQDDATRGRVKEELDAKGLNAAVDPAPEIARQSGFGEVLLSRA